LNISELLSSPRPSPLAAFASSRLEEALADGEQSLLNRARLESWQTTNSAQRDCSSVVCTDGQQHEGGGSGEGSAARHFFYASSSFGSRSSLASFQSAISPRCSIASVGYESCAHDSFPDGPDGSEPHDSAIESERNSKQFAQSKASNISTIFGAFL
jgi:hypothetical protein